MTIAVTRGLGARSVIRGLMAERAQAARDKNIERIMQDYDDDVVAFEFGAPLAQRGKEALRHECEQGYAEFPGAVEYEERDVHVTAKGDLGFSHSLEHIAGTRRDGTRMEMWSRATLCWRRIGGRWLITHQHLSVPMDGEGGRALLDLKP